MKLLLLLALTQPPGKVIIYRAELTPISSGYPAIIDGPVLCGDRLLTRGYDYWITGNTMQVTCPPTEKVSTFLASWVEVEVTPVVRRRP